MGRVTPSIVSALCCALTASACTEDAAGDGDVTVTVYGEDFIEVGIPADEMADGWAVTFDRFDVSIDQIIIGGVRIPATGAVDISAETGGAGHQLATAKVPVGEHTGSSFAIARVELSGSATRDGVTKTFAWTFDQETHYDSCEPTTSVARGEDATFQVTVHADHYFYDSLVSEEPALAFQALADADADADGVITRAELEVADIGSYDPGSDGGIDDLWSWLVAQNRTLGHVDGEGHCDSHAH